MTLLNARNVDARYSNFNAVCGDQYIINQCFSQTPVSHLSDVFLSFKNIARSVDQVKSNERQLGTLEFVVATLLLTLDAEYRGRRLSKSRTAGPLADLHRYMIVAVMTLSFLTLAFFQATERDRSVLEGEN
jgi:hypothetical protein